MNEKILSIDIETTGLDPWTDKILCIGVYTPEFQKVYRNIEQFAVDMISYQQQGYHWVGQNFKFDLKFLLCNNIGHDFIASWKYDTQLMMHVCTDKMPETYIEAYEEKRREINKDLPIGHRHRAARRYSLKCAAPYWLKVQPFWETAGNYDNDEYVLKDCKYTYDLFMMFYEKLQRREELEFFQEQLKRTKMLLEAELRGITLDTSKLLQVELETTAEVVRLKGELDVVWDKAHEAHKNKEASDLHIKYTEMEDIAILKNSKNAEKIRIRYQKLYDTAVDKLEKKINFDSPKQMTWLLRDHFGHSITTFEGEESTGKATLERLSDQGHKDIGLFLEYRKTNKILTSFLPTYKELSRDGIIHPTFNETGTRTGRLSSSDPNMQQVPPGLYQLFKPRDGYTFIQYDYASIEAILLAFYAEDPMLYDLIKNDKSIHNANAKIFFNLDCEIEDVKDKYPKERNVAKHIGFALFYGAGINRILETFANFGFVITEHQAREIHENMKEHYKQVFDFHKQLTKAFESGDVIRNVVGRPIKIQAWESAYMNGLNTLVQSSASDMLLLAAYNANVEMESAAIDATPLLFVHDAVLFEVDKGHAAKADKIIRKHLLGFDLTTELGKIDLQIEGGINDVWKK